MCVRACVFVRACACVCVCVCVSECVCLVCCQIPSIYADGHTTNFMTSSLPGHPKIAMYVQSIPASHPYITSIPASQPAILIYPFIPFRSHPFPSLDTKHFSCYSFFFLFYINTRTLTRARTCVHTRAIARARTHAYARDIADLSTRQRVLTCADNTTHTHVYILMTHTDSKDVGCNGCYSSLRV